MKTHILLYPSHDIVEEYNEFVLFTNGMEISIGDKYNAFTYKIGSFRCEYRYFECVYKCR